MPRESSGLPQEVRFAKWTKYQHTNATHFARIETAIVYDTRTEGGDGATGRLLRGILLAVMGHGTVNVGAWIGQCRDKKGARSDIKSWIDNGLLETVPSQIDREIDRTTTTPRAAPVALVVEKPAEPRKPKVARAKISTPSWTTRFADELAKHMGGIAQYGTVGKHLKPLVARDGEDVIWPAWQMFCASEKAQYGAHWFAGNAGVFLSGAGPVNTSNADVCASLRRIKAMAGRYSGPQMTPSSAWAELQPADRALIKAAGGLRVVWEVQDEERFARQHAAAYRAALTNGNGAAHGHG